MTADVRQHVPDETKGLHCRRDGRVDRFLKAEVVSSWVTFTSVLSCSDTLESDRCKQRVTGESTLTQSKQHRRT